MRRKPMTLAVAVLVVLSSALTLAGPAEVLTRLFGPIRGSDERTMVDTGSQTDVQLVARLPQAGQVDYQHTGAAVVETASNPAPTHTSIPSPTRVIPAATSSSGPTLIAVGEIEALLTAAAVAAVPAPATLAPPPAVHEPEAVAAPATQASGSSDVAPGPTASVPSTATPAPADAPPTEPAPTTAPPTEPAPTAPSPTEPAPTDAPQRQTCVPDRIVAEGIGLDSSIIPSGWRVIINADGSKSAEWNVAEYAVSWHKTSAKLGEVGNTVLTGHNNIVGEVFRRLEDLDLGDPVTIYCGQQAFQYEVADKFVVQEVGVPYEQRLENAKWIGKFPDERVTLMSCYPYTGETHRIFIILKPAG